jgi:class 3 adenylate cyclase
MLPDQARAEYERARDVLEASGPSEALAIAYIRLAGLAMFNDRYEEALQTAIRGGEIAKETGAGLALAWSWNFRAGPEIGLGRVEEGFLHLEESYRLAPEGNHHAQATNATYNAVWIALHLGLGRLARAWLDRNVRDQPGDRVYVWVPYLEGLLLAYEGLVNQAVFVLRGALDLTTQAGHEKMIWRSRVALAHALAEADQASEASGILPSLSSRVESQDAIYDGAARIRTRLALRDLAGALEAARTVSPSACTLGSPFDAIAEAAGSEPDWLAAFLAATRICGEVERSPRLAVARGRLALAQGRNEEALPQLERADATFRQEGLLLDAWHTGRALAEAEARLGREAAAADRLQLIIREAEMGGAVLAARLARETGAALGIGLPEPELAQVGGIAGLRDAEPHAGISERLVTVMFVDVRGYTAMTGQKAPHDMADKIASFYRWAQQESERHHGRVMRHAGDAVMATFNVSGVRLDHTVQALQAAIAIRDKMAYMGMPVGTGIAVGPAIVGQLSEATELTAIGEAPNLAARLQAKADRGEIVLSREAHRRVRDWLTERGIATASVQLELKGFDQPVAAYRIAASPTEAAK